MTAAETFGQQAIVAKTNLQAGFNPTYFSLSNTTFYEIWMNWDPTCGGGIFWSRIRTGSNADLKSTITHVEEMELGARLFAMTGNADYKLKFDQIYDWLKSTGIISSDYTVYDGVTIGACAVSKQVYSYHTGELMAALSIMYQQTKNQTYLTEAQHIFAAVQRQFVTASTNVLDIEPSCSGANSTCKSPTGYHFAIYKGLANLYKATTDSSVQAQIAAVVQSSAKVNFQGCDSNWYCIRDLPKGTGFTLENGTNPRDQFETMAILNSLAVINGASVTVAPSGGGSSTAATTTSSSFVLPALGTAGVLIVAGWISFMM
ncbi:hydrolase 76 protein [Podochytrium sp. JEL0797]|nr:hydrolase 76 protein [Podochytrium sp. JEL0797]